MMFFTSSLTVAQRKDTSFIDALNLKAWKLKGTELEAAKKYALQALGYAQKINYDRGLSFSYNVLGHYDKVKGRYDSAFYYYQKSLTIRRRLHDTIAIANAYKNIASIYKAKGENDKAITTDLIAVRLLATKPHDKTAIKDKARIQINLADLYLNVGAYDAAIQNALEAQRTFARIDDPDGLALAANTLGNIYQELEEDNKALMQFKEALRLRQELPDQRELSKVYNNLGSIYYDRKQYGEALSNFKEGLRINQSNGYDDDLSYSFLNVGTVYEDFNKNDSALLYYNESLKISQQSGDAESQLKAHSAIGSFFLKQNNFKSAIKHLQEALSLASKTNNLPGLADQLKGIAQAYGNDSTFAYLMRYTTLHDSINEVSKKAISLESTIKSKQLVLDLSEEKNRSQRYVIIAMFIVVVLMGIIIFLFFRSFVARKRMLQLQDIIKEQELLALDAMIEGQESERKRLAAELHDTIGSILSAIKYAFKSMESSLLGYLVEGKMHYQKINYMLDEAMESVRRISHDMATGVLLEKGIGDALWQLCDMLQQTGKIQIRLAMFGFDEKIESALELNLYRMIQELLTNILKHSNAQNVSIQLIKSDGNINLLVEDDGRGFNPKELSAKHGIGLSNIDKRVKGLSGTWDIDSGRGKGTTVVIDIPLNDANT